MTLIIILIYLFSCYTTYKGTQYLSGSNGSPQLRNRALNLLLFGEALRLIILFYEWLQGLPLTYAVIAQMTPLTSILLYEIVNDLISKFDRKEKEKIKIQ